jgi:hypothetical protein
VQRTSKTRHSFVIYCGMSAESRNSSTRRDVHYYVTVHWTSRQLSNSYVRNNRGTVGSCVLCGSAQRLYLENLNMEHNELLRDSLGGCSPLVRLTRAVLRSCTVSRHATPATTDTSDIWEKLANSCIEASATTENSENRSVRTGSQFV